MRVFFRVDASVHIGTGHVMRCLVLAEALREEGAECQFICREQKGHLLEKIREKGFKFHRLPFYNNFEKPLNLDTNQEINHIAWLGTNWFTDVAETKACIDGMIADWMIVDHYAIDIRWEKEMRSICQKLMVIDDLADRKHDCDILLDQNFYRNQEQRYEKLLPIHCKKLFGPAYILLDSKYKLAQLNLRKRDFIVKRIIVFFGGSDTKNQTKIVLAALKKLNLQDISVDVIVGQINQNCREIQLMCDQQPNVSYHYNISNMAELIMRADLGIGAGGYAMWERCFLGLPTITTVVAGNQVRVTEDVAEVGAIEYLGSCDLLGVDDYAHAISRLISNPQYLKNISDSAISMMKKDNMISVTDEILKFTKEFSINQYK